MEFANVATVMSPRLSHLRETSLYVDDLPAAKSFYQRLFGFESILEDERMVGLQLPGSAVLLLFCRDRSGAPRGVAGRASGGRGPAPDSEGAHHLCLPIPAASMPEWERHLMLQGIAVESHAVQSDGGASLYFRDLDGHSLELTTPGAVAEHPL